MLYTVICNEIKAILSRCRSVASCLTVLAATIVVLAAPDADAGDAAPATETAEATAIADQAFKDYDAKRYRQAAQGFFRAYELSGGQFPRQLRNAAKALYAGGFLEEALDTWTRIESVAGTEAQLRVEAKEQVSKLRAELAGLAQQQAEAARRGKQHSQAGDQYARGYAVSGGMRTDLLIAASESYEAANRLDDAHLAWGMAATALAAQPDAQPAALSGIDRLVGRLRKIPGAEAGYAAYVDKRWEAAAAELLRHYDAVRERCHLRHAALALEAVGKAQDAESAWTRYEQAAVGSRLAVAEAHRRLALIRSERLSAEARAAAAQGRHAAAADKWLAVYELAKGRNLEALRESAIAFENAGDAERAKTWWRRLQDSETATEAWRKEAAEHVANGAKPGPVAALPVVVAPPAPPPGCSLCLPLIGGGAALSIAGAVLVGLARSDQADLVAALATKDAASGKVVGTSYASADEQQKANVSRSNLGIGLLATGLLTAATGGVMQLLLPQATVRTTVAPTVNGQGLVALWSGRF